MKKLKIDIGSVDERSSPSPPCPQEEKKMMTNMTMLYDDAMVSIFSFLTPRENLKLSVTSTRLRTISQLPRCAPCQLNLSYKMKSEVITKLLSKFNSTSLEIECDKFVSNYHLILKMSRLRQLMIIVGKLDVKILNKYPLTELTSLERFEMIGYYPSFDFSILPRSVTNLSLSLGYRPTICTRSNFASVFSLTMLQSLSISGTLIVERNLLNDFGSRLPHLTTLSIERISTNCNLNPDDVAVDGTTFPSLTSLSLRIAIAITDMNSISNLNYWTNLKVLKLEICRSRSGDRATEMTMMNILVTSFENLEQLSIVSDSLNPSFLQDFCSAIVSANASLSPLIKSLRSLDIRVETNRRDISIDHSPLSILSNLTDLTINGNVSSEEELFPHLSKLERLNLWRISSTTEEIGKLLKSCATLYSNTLRHLTLPCAPGAHREWHKTGSSNFISYALSFQHLQTLHIYSFLMPLKKSDSSEMLLEEFRRVLPGVAIYFILIGEK